VAGGLQVEAGGQPALDSEEAAQRRMRAAAPGE
jgi:hypothetical protein